MILNLEFDEFKKAYDFTNELIKILFVNEDGKYIFKTASCSKNDKKLDMDDCVPTLIGISLNNVDKSIKEKYEMTKVMMQYAIILLNKVINNNFYGKMYSSKKHYFRIRENMIILREK